MLVDVGLRDIAGRDAEGVVYCVEGRFVLVVGGVGARPVEGCTGDASLAFSRGFRNISCPISVMDHDCFLPLPRTKSGVLDHESFN